VTTSVSNLNNQEENDTEPIKTPITSKSGGMKLSKKKDENRYY
jgi:hypothetical protein